MEAVTQFHAGAAGLPFPWRHRLMGHEQIVQPAGSRQPRVERRIQHAGGIAQQQFGVVQRQRLHESLWREAGPAAEQMMQFVGRHAGGIGDVLNARLVLPLSMHEADGAADAVVVAQGRIPQARLDGAMIIHRNISGEVHHAAGLTPTTSPNHPIPDQPSHHRIVGRAAFGCLQRFKQGTEKACLFLCPKEARD